MTIKVIEAAKTPNGAGKPSYCQCFIDDSGIYARKPIKK